MRSAGRSIFLLLVLWAGLHAGAWAQALPAGTAASAPVVGAVEATPAAAPAAVPAPPPLTRPGMVPQASINGADTAWMMTSTALVLLMTLPGRIR